MKQRKIFIVEDDLILLETLTDILTTNGYLCKGSEDADGALDAIQQYQPDLVIIDYMLPEWNGGELCGAIRGIDGIENVPVIMMSAYANVLFSMKEYGCNAILEKPFAIHELLSVIECLLGNQSADSGLMQRIRMIFKGSTGKKE